MSFAYTATTDLAYIGGDNPPALRQLRRSTRRTRKPVRIVGAPQWSDRAIAAVVELSRQKLTAAGPNSDPLNKGEQHD